MFSLFTLFMFNFRFQNNPEVALYMYYDLD